MFEHTSSFAGSTWISFPSSAWKAAQDLLRLPKGGKTNKTGAAANRGRTRVAINPCKCFCPPSLTPRPSWSRLQPLAQQVAQESAKTWGLCLRLHFQHLGGGVSRPSTLRVGSATRELLLYDEEPDENLATTCTLASYTNTSLWLGVVNKRCGTKSADTFMSHNWKVGLKVRKAT